MKVLVFENNCKISDRQQKNLPGWYILSDSSVTNTGKPFFLPEEYGRVTASVGVAIKISRLGKGIAPGFASRYYTQYAPVLQFHLPDFERKLQEEGRPADASRNFDRALFTGDFIPYRETDIINLKNKGNIVKEISFDNLVKGVDELISEVSVMNTMKIGDLIVAGISEAVEVREGDLLEVSVNGKDAFFVKIK